MSNHAVTSARVEGLENPTSSASTTDRGKDRSSKTTRRGNCRRLLFVALYSVYIFALLWGGAHLYYYLTRPPILSGKASEEQIWCLHYSELAKSHVLDADLSKNDDTFDVLLLGGSVLEWSADLLEEELHQSLNRPLRLFNLAKSAHTTRDSLLKFSTLQENYFDLIIVYHGINDVRMNCCPEEDFRNDYSHCFWYRSLYRRLEAGAIWDLKITQDEFLGTIAPGIPKVEQLEFGSIIKTREPFGQNIEGIIRQAAESEQPVLLMSFAYYIPADYSKEKFEAEQLDYTKENSRVPIELWGKLENVGRTIDAHNQQILELAARHPEVMFVPQDRLVEKTGKNFVDICHLSEEGKKKFVSNIMLELRRSIGQKNFTSE